MYLTGCVAAATKTKILSGSIGKFIEAPAANGKPLVSSTNASKPTYTSAVLEAGAIIVTESFADPVATADAVGDTVLTPYDPLVRVLGI